MKHIGLRIILKDMQTTDLLGVAKTKFVNVERLRLRLGLPIMEKRYEINGEKIYIRSSNWDNMIVFEGGYAEIYLSGAELDGLYSYSSDTLISVRSAASGSLHQLYNRKLLDDDSVINGTSATVIDSNSLFEAFNFDKGSFTTLQQIRTALGVSNNQLVTIKGVDNELSVATDPLPDACSWSKISNNGLVALIQGQQRTQPHTLFNGNIQWMYTLKTGHILPNFRWYPSMHYGDGHVHDGYGLWGQGFIYGHPAGYITGHVTEDGFSAAASMEVMFGCNLQQLSTSVKLGNYGYCEVLKKTDDQVRNVLVFFVSLMPILQQGNTGMGYDGAFSEEYRGSIISSMINTGYVDLSEVLPLDQDINVSFWNTKSAPQDLDAIIDKLYDKYGVVAVQGNKAAVIRGTTYLDDTYGIAGAFGVIHTIDDYHSHSVSSDGRILALFHGITTISAVTVIDLECYAEIDYEDRASSGKAAWEIIRRNSSVVSSVTAQSGELIPYSEKVMENKGLTRILVNYVSLEQTGDIESEFDTAYGGTWTRYREVDADYWWKVICDDGVHAHGRIYTDECRTGVVTGITCDEEYLDEVATFTVEGESYTGTFNTIDLPYMQFIDDMDGNRAVIYLCRWEGSIADVKPKPVDVTIPSFCALIEVDHEIGIFGTVGCPEDFLHVGGNPLGPYSYDEVWEWIGDSAWRIEETNCGGFEGIQDYTYSGVNLIQSNDNCTTFNGGVLRATTKCGQVAEIEYEEDNPAPELVVTKINPDENGVYQAVSITGGQSPYYVSIDDGELVIAESFSIDSTICNPHTYQFFDTCGRESDVFEEIEDVPLYLSGAEVAEVGNFYSGSGGCPPYTYSISGGEIDESSGEIISVVCGSGTVTVTDSVDQTTSMDVKFPSGHWAYVSRDVNPMYYTEKYSWAFPAPWDPAQYVNEQDPDDIQCLVFGKYMSFTMCGLLRSHSACSWTPGAFPIVDWYLTTIDQCDYKYSSGNRWAGYHGAWLYEWVC